MGAKRTVWSALLVVVVVGSSPGSVVTAHAQSGLPDAGLVNVAGRAGIAETTVAYHVSVADYDRDGREDFLFNRRWKVAMRLYRNAGSGRFVEDVRTNFGIADRLDCEWGDPNVDSRPDLYCSVGAQQGTATKRNELWIQQSGGGFANQAAAWNVTDPYGRGRQVTFLNFNGDRYPDLFLGNHYPRQDGIPSPNRVFVNVSGTTFRELVVPGVTAEIGARCASATDIDGDGFDDLLVCGNNALRIYRNNGNNGFQNMAPALNLNNNHADAVAVDLDGDGDRDLVLTSGGRTRVRLQTAPWVFGAARVVATGEARNVATPDIDNDGDLDLYVVRDGTNPNLADLLLRNRGSGVFDAFVVGASTSQGFAKMAAAIDHDRDGRDAVLVVNSNDGRTVPGPLELMAPVP